MKCAVVGLGIGLAHAAGYLRSDGATLSYVCDLQPERLAALGGTFRQGSMGVLKPLFTAEEREAAWEDLGVTPTDSLERVLEDASIDLVSLCTPDYTHHELALKILRSGKHLLLEKPLALTLPEAREVADEAVRAGVRLAVGYEFRINPAVLALRDLVTSGSLGTIHAVALYHFRTPFRRDKWNKWIQSRALSGGLLIEETCHWFDLLEFIPGLRVESLHVVGTDKIHPDFDYEDLAFVQGRYTGGAVFQLSHALTGHDFNLVLQLHGSDGTAWCGLKEAVWTSLDAGVTTHLGVVSWAPRNASSEEARVTTFGTEATEPENIRDMVVETVHAVESGGPVAAGAEAGIRSLEVALAARASLEKREEVTI